MKERAQEKKAAARNADGEKVVSDKLGEIQEPDRAMGGRLHEIIKASAPDLTPRQWYGMPAYEKDGKVVCFFQSGGKFKTRHATLGFNDSANLDDPGRRATRHRSRVLDSRRRLVLLDRDYL
jgi:hypothetical protein